MTAPPANATSNSRALAGVVTEVQKDQRLMRSYRYSEQRLSQKGQFL